MKDFRSIGHDVREELEHSPGGGVGRDEGTVPALEEAVADESIHRLGEDDLERRAHAVDELQLEEAGEEQRLGPHRLF